MHHSVYCIPNYIVGCRARQCFFVGDMCRYLFVVLSGIALASCFNLEYLDPIKLQTVASTEIQKQAALKIITKYIESDRVLVEIDPLWFKDNKDTFSLNILEGRLQIRASTGVAAAWAFNYYLKKYCKSQIEWQTKNVNIPTPLPYVKEIVVANDRFRYYQNVCTVSYSFVWWQGDDWYEHLGWMALNGINLALVPVAQEAAWARIYKSIGMTQEEIDQHMTGPAFLSWLRMGNVHGWGGPLTESWHRKQTVIENGVVLAMLDLGIVPVLPAFNGHVPVAFSRLYPNSTFHKVSQWNNFGQDYCCGLFVDPSDPIFKVIGDMFLNTTNTPGVHIYTADPFNEVTLSEFSTPFVRDTAAAIFSTLSAFDRNAVWLLQNWMFVSDPLMWPRNRVQAFINAVPNGRMLILDLQAEQWPQYDLYKMYFGQPFIWCMLHNFGGTLGMFGNMVTINRDVYEVRSRTNSTMIGIGLTPEGINQNYVVYDLMLESAWRKSSVRDLDAWAADYAERRYGCNETALAWKYLLKSVYSFNGLNRVRGKYVVTRKPSFRIKPWAWYNSTDLFRALRYLVSANHKNCHSEGFEYDLVDVTRQALQYRVEQLYTNVVSDRSTNTFVFENSINRFLNALDDMASILEENEHFLAKNWFEKARELGVSDEEKYMYEMNARNQITLWGPKGEISDYACKQWAELLRDYYNQRWRMFLDAALQAKKSGELFNEKAVRRVITATVEIPFVTVFPKNYYFPIKNKLSVSDLLDVAKGFYRKWVYVADVDDLPIMIVNKDYSGLSTPVIDDYSESDETPESPVVTLYTTPIV